MNRANQHSDYGRRQTIQQTIVWACVTAQGSLWSVEWTCMTVEGRHRQHDGHRCRRRRRRRTWSTTWHLPRPAHRHQTTWRWLPETAMSLSQTTPSSCRHDYKHDTSNMSSRRGFLPREVVWIQCPSVADRETDSGVSDCHTQVLTKDIFKLHPRLGSNIILDFCAEPPLPSYKGTPRRGVKYTGRVEK